MNSTAARLPGRWFHALDDGRLQCDLCPRRCRLRDGQRAFCFVRIRRGDRIELDTWGRSTGFCIDPIEKKPLAHFLPGTPVLSFGTAGCNLGCRYCQNWTISKSRETDSLCERAEPDAIARAAVAHGCPSVAFTYNDPVPWAEYAIDTANACRRLGVKTVAVTAGFVTPEARPELFGAIDAANVDLKAFTETFYRDQCLSKPGGLSDVLDTIRWLKHESKVWLELTTLLIPGLNDGDDELRELTRWVVTELGPDVPLHFSAFHPAFKLRDVPPTSPTTVLRARRIALDAGVHHVYAGNVDTPDAQTTHCPSCGALAIARHGYRITAYHLTAAGACAACGARLAGVFGTGPGDWGPRRAPVLLGDPPAQAGT